MWIVAAEIAVIYMLSTLPTPLYVLYRQAFHFSQITLTVIYAVYVIGTVAIMFFFGRLADQIGRRPIVLVSLAMAAGSAAIFLCSNRTGWLFLGRILSGLAIALAAGASTAWVTELEPRHDKRKATRMVIASNLVGLGLGALVAGLLAQYAIWPLRLPYLAFLGLLAPTIFFIWKSEETVENPKAMAEACMRPRIGVPRELRARFISPAVCAFAIFSVLGFYTALLPSLLSEAFQNRNHAVAGLVVAEIFLVGAIAVVFAGSMSPRKGLFLALGLLLPSVGLLVAAQSYRAFAVLLIATGISGVATGLGYHYSLLELNDLAPKDKRSEMVSSYLIACYCGISLPVIGIGFLAKATSLMLADSIFAGVIAVITCVVLVILARTSRQPAAPRNS